MRGTDKISGSLFRYVDIEDCIPARHPLRQVKRLVDDALASLDAEFARLYATEGRSSIPPERLMRASLIQILFSVRVTPKACLLLAPARRRAGGAAHRQREYRGVEGRRRLGRVNPTYRRYAGQLKFHVDACQPRQPQAKGKVERSIGG